MFDCGMVNDSPLLYHVVDKVIVGLVNTRASQVVHIFGKCWFDMSLASGLGNGFADGLSNCLSKDLGAGLNQWFEQWLKRRFEQWLCLITCLDNDLPGL